MRTISRRKTWLALASAALMLGVFQGAQSANAAAFLWVSAPNWSYSAAAAASPIGSIYFWGLSVGPGTYSWAYAFSHDPPFGSADAFAEASAGGLGGVGAVDVAGIADPYAGIGIDVSLTDPSNPSGFPTSKPGTDPLSTPYTVSGTGITFTGSGNELNGTDELQAFIYNGPIDESTLDTELGAPANSESGNTGSGDVTDLSTLQSDFNLLPLDAPILDPSSLTGLTFTENDSSVNPADVILVGEGNAASAPEPASLFLLAVGTLGLALRRRGVTA